MKKKSLLIAVAAIVLTVVSACSVTLAWLTATSGDVTNTFTVGNITIQLWEHEWDKDAETTGADTVTENDYKVVPGATDEKDPFVIVNKGSESCYVYVAVTNNLVINGNEVATINWNTDDWTYVGQYANTTTNIVTYLYRYNIIVDASTANVPTSAAFDSITYSGENIDSKNIGSLTDKQVVVKAFAHQAENASEEVANTAAENWAQNIANPSTSETN